MKTLTVAAIENRYKKSNITPMAQVYDIKGPSGYRYNKLLKIIIPGKPIADSRPRHNSSTGVMYNGHKNSLMRIFEYMYNGSKLEEVCILSQMKVELNVYVPVVKKYVKLFNKKEKESLEKGIMGAPVRPDNDNYEKIHFDILQDDKFMIILRDEAIIDNTTKKFFVKDEKDCRVEIMIQYSDKLEKWYEDSVIHSTSYLKYLCSPKYMRIIKLPENKWKDYFFNTIIKFKREHKNLQIVKPIHQLLKKLSTKEVNILGEGRNRDDSVNNILKKVERI